MSENLNCHPLPSLIFNARDFHLRYVLLKPGRILQTEDHFVIGLHVSHHQPKVVENHRPKVHCLNSSVQYNHRFCPQAPNKST